MILRVANDAKRLQFCFRDRPVASAESRSKRSRRSWPPRCWIDGRLLFSWRSAAAEGPTLASSCCSSNQRCITFACIASATRQIDGEGEWCRLLAVIHEDESSRPYGLNMYNWTKRGFRQHWQGTRACPYIDLTPSWRPQHFLKCLNDGWSLHHFTPIFFKKDNNNTVFNIVMRYFNRWKSQLGMNDFFAISNQHLTISQPKYKIVTWLLSNNKMCMVIADWPWKNLKVIQTYFCYIKLLLLLFLLYKHL